MKRPENINFSSESFNSPPLFSIIVSYPFFYLRIIKIVVEMVGNPDEVPELLIVSVARYLHLPLLIAPNLR